MSMREELNNMFNLTKNGGIYFDGERIASQEGVVSLMIGLGGMGVKTVLQIKNQVMNRMKLPTNDDGRPLGIPPRNVAFLGFDTNKKDLTGHYSSTTMDGTEMVNVSPGDGNNWGAIINNMLIDKHNAQEYADFLPENLLQAGTAAEAGARRLMGRVGFFHHAGTITRKITQSIDELRGHNTNINRTYIFVFGGISGGTGSGMFIDMGYLLKTLVPNSELFGYFYLSDLNDKDPGDLQGRDANTFAALEELDWVLERGKPTTAPDRTYMYGSQATDRMRAKSPYDYCHILNRTDTAHNVKEKDDVIRSVAESVFTYISQEDGVGLTSTTGTSTFYNNISAYLMNNNSNVSYPAFYNYISPNSISLRIPYMEISTLIAGRMFVKLDSDVFQKNKVTPQTMDADMRLLGLGGRGNFEDTLSALLENAAPSPMNFNSIDYDQIRSKQAWNETYSHAQKYESAMQDCYGTMAGHNENAGTMEGKLKNFLRTQIASLQRGPFYIQELINGSSGTDNLVGLFQKRKNDFAILSDEAQEDAKTAKDICDDMFNMPEPSHGFLGFGDKRKEYREKYVQALQNWHKAICTRDKYHYLSLLCDRMAEVYRNYHDHILKPLTDILFDLVAIFKDNIEYLNTKENEYKKNPDPSLLITPLKFENSYQHGFDTCVNSAVNSFLQMITGTMKDWIKSDLDNIKGEVGYHTDIQGRLSNFISECFRNLYGTLTMESVLNTKVPNGMTLQDYVTNIINNMDNRTYPLFKKNVLPAPTQQFVIISYPANCSNIAAAVTGVVNANPNAYTPRPSDEKNRLSLVKIEAGFALLNNELLPTLEANYEQTARTNAVFLHTNRKWRGYITSPYVETAWDSGYSCTLTREHNKKYRDMFIRCYKNGCISIPHSAASNEAILMVSNGSYNVQDLKLTISNDDTPIEYVKAILDNIRANVQNTSKKIMMTGIGIYSMKADVFLKYGASNDDARILSNVMENVIRNPEICDILEEECKQLDILEQLQYIVTRPYVFMEAWLCGMITIDQYTDIVKIRTSELMPIPKTILDSAMEHINRDSYEFFFRIYQNFSEILDEPADVNSDATWEDVIKNNYTIYTQNIADEEAKQKKTEKIQDFTDKFHQLYLYYRNLAQREYNLNTRTNYEKIAMVYALCKEAVSQL